MRALAEEYCRLIEGLEHRPADWLERLNNLLPRLHAAVASLAGSRGDGHHYLDPNLDARFELYTRLRDLLGDDGRAALALEHVGDTGATGPGQSGDQHDVGHAVTLLTHPSQPER